MSLLLLASTAAHAQLAAKIVAANGAGSDIYSVAFAGSAGTTTVLNTDASAHTGIRSLVFRPNPDTGAIDLIAADTSRGQVLLYANGIGNSQVIWKPGSAVANPVEGAGPIRPDGMSLDSSGNLYVASSTSGEKIKAELWVFPRNSFGPLPGSFGLPRLVDNDFGKETQLIETLSVKGGTGLAPTGNLLLLTSEPARVLSYSAAGLQSVLAGSGEIDPVVLIPAIRLPEDTRPGGMDLWPLDGTLLITTYNKILRFSSTAQLPDFATGLGNGKQNKFKIRAARLGTSAIAVVADNSNGRILQFNDLGVLTAVVTAGVNRPQALATTNASTASANCYQSAEGCDLLGGILKTRALNIPPNSTAGFLLQEPCIVNTDPRYNASTGTWIDVPLPIASVCPGFGTSVIPAYLHGGSGPTGKGFAVVSSESNFILPQGAEVASKVYSENLLGNKPVCTASGTQFFSAEIVTWAPTVGEGSIIESNGQLDATVGCENPLLAGTRGGSDWTFGLVLDDTSAALAGVTSANKLHSFTGGKFINLLATVQAAQIQSTVKTSLTSCLTASKAYFDTLKYSKALTKLAACNVQVRNAYIANPGNFVSTAANPNPYGDIVTRIANLDYTLRYRQSAVVVSLSSGDDDDDHHH
ncbi:MAG: hypothetical protein ABL964_07495 [Steroidobacteraceae bacterium]